MDDLHYIYTQTRLWWGGQGGPGFLSHFITDAEGPCLMLVSYMIIYVQQENPKT